MPLIKADRVKETSTSTGTGAFSLAGATNGFRRFSSVCSVGDTVHYVIDSDTGSEWETGLGTYSSANTLTRTTVHSSSNSGSLVSFSAGTKNVYLSLTARQINTISASPPPSTGAPAKLVEVIGANHTALTAGTEYSDIFFNLTRTVQFSTGDISNQRAVRISPPTYSFVGASTITEAATVQIDGGPVAGTNATINRQVGLKIVSNGDSCTALVLQLTYPQNANLFEVLDDTGLPADFDNRAAISKNGKYTTYKDSPANFGFGLGEAFGDFASTFVSTGSSFGYASFAGGQQAVALGYQASANAANSMAIGGSSLTFPSAQQAIALGCLASATATNSIAIGYQAFSGTNNTIVLGNSSISSLRCQVQTISSLSDCRDKTNFRPIGSVLGFVSSLNPVRFDWNMRDGAKVGVQDYGFIAQDLLAAQQKNGFEWAELVDQSDPGKLLASYCKLVPIITRAIQELTQKVAELESKIS